MLKKLKIFLSYISPFVTNRASEYNGNLKIMLVNGKKVLNTKDANYSFASLHRIMRFALTQTGFDSREDILLLWLGGWSVIDLIRNEFHLPNTIRAVDIDPVIIEVARQEFALDSYADVEIICQDAYNFVQETPKKHGLIIIDLFINNTVPEKFYDDIFWENIFRILSPTGRIIFNTMTKTTKGELFGTIITRLKTVGFQVEVHDKVDFTNSMILAKRR